MTTLKQIIFASVVVLALLSTAAAQDSATAQKVSLTITAATAGDRVRITAPSSVVQMHVEAYAASGERVFDQEIRGGNVFDWHLQDGQAQRLAPGSYVCVVTAKSVSGKLTQKIGAVRVEEKSVSVQPGDSQQLSAPQAQTIGPVEENSSWTITGENEPQTTTVIAHDGTDGQMIRGRGALTFRIGNFFSGIDQEQMRLTEAGDLGLGTSEPRAKLDVAGTIRAQRFVVAKPLDKTTSAAQSDSANQVQPLVAGTGTTGQLTKWIDGASGTLGDSVITETLSGNIGIGTNNPTDKLEVKDGSVSTYHANASFGAGYSLNFYTDTTGSAKNTIGSLGVLQSAANVRAGDFVVNLSNAGAPAEKFRITKAGNVGIGTTNPTDKLEVKDGFISTYHPNASFGAGYTINFYTDTTGATKNTIGQIGVVQSAANVRAGDFVVNLSSAGAPAERFRINNLGNVGIGTPNPATKLDVAGDINTSTGFNILGSRVLSGSPNNIFVGRDSGSQNTTSYFNTFVGVSSGFNNQAESYNTFLGFAAGYQNGLSDINSVAERNTFIGSLAGNSNQTGQGNTFVGSYADFDSQTPTGNNNTLLGFHASVSSGKSNATAIGAGAGVAQSNSLVLGSTIGPGTNVGIGTQAPLSTLDVVNSAAQVRFGNTTSDNGGYLVSTSPTQGVLSGGAKWNGSAWVAKDTTASFIEASGGTINFYANSGLTAGSTFPQTQQMTIGSSGAVQIYGTLGLAGTLVLSTLGSANTTTTLCRNTFNQIATCNSSSLRYKTNVTPFISGLDIVNRLRPISFTWKQGGARDVGFGAEDVAKVEPLFTFRNEKGEIEGVKYDRLSVALVNAIKEQQREIEQLRRQVLQLRAHPRRHNRRDSKRW